MLDPAEDDGDPVGDLLQELGAPSGELGLVEVLCGECRGKEKEESEQSQPAHGCLSHVGGKGA